MNEGQYVEITIILFLGENENYAEKQAFLSLKDLMYDIYARI